MIKVINKNAISIILCVCAWCISILCILMKSDPFPTLLTMVVIITIHLLAALSDIYNRIIPLKLTLSALVIGILIYVIFYNTKVGLNYILAGFFAFIIVKILIVITKSQIGGGDLALMTVTGLFVGVASFFSILFIAILLSGIYSVILLLIKKVDKKTEIPFAPFILLATMFLVLTNVL